MIDFSTLRGLTIPEGVVAQVNNGDVIYWRAGGEDIVLEVAKITSDTYAAETSYTGETFILLDIYPKSGGTVNVTYGELTKTITDDGTSENPNAQQVFFGTFNGVSDSVETPASGTLTIRGDCAGFAVGTYDETKKNLTNYYNGVISVNDFGSVEFIPNSALYECTSLTSINIPYGVTNIDDHAFYGCRGLTSVTIPASVTSIGQSAFGNCIKLTNINIPSGVTSIELNTFSGCKSLTNINIPPSVTSIGATSFLYCSNLTSVEIPAGVTNIGDRAFQGCTSLTSVEIPASVTSIGINPWCECFENNAISVADGNTAYTISGNCLVEIDSSTIVAGFADADVSGAEVNFMKLKKIGDYAFYGCTGLTSAQLTYIEKIGSHAFYNCKGLTSVAFTDSGVGLGMSVGDYAFYGCTGLTSITLPYNTSSNMFDLTIHDYAFFLTDGYTRTITALSEKPYKLSGGGVFDVAGANTFIVPAGCGEAYKTANYWNEYADYIVEVT